MQIFTKDLNFRYCLTNGGSLSFEVLKQALTVLASLFICLYERYVEEPNLLMMIILNICMLCLRRCCFIYFLYTQMAQEVLSHQGVNC